MKSKSEKIERIPNYFINDDCSQITLSFRNNITLFSSDIYSEGILCHYDFKDDSQNINKYLLDDRRTIFPYASIPMYKGLFGKFYINQLFEYNKHYLSITDGFVRDRYIVQDDNEVVMLNRKISIPSSIRGNSYSSKDIEKILRDIDALSLFDRNGREYFYNGKYLLKLDNFIKNGGGVFILKDDNGKIEIKIVRINNDIGFDNYIYKEYDFPLNDYTAEELRYFCSKMKDSYEPSVCSLLNPNIDRKDIREAKRLIRKLSSK